MNPYYVQTMPQPQNYMYGGFPMPHPSSWHTTVFYIDGVAILDHPNSYTVPLGLMNIYQTYTSVQYVPNPRLLFQRPTRSHVEEVSIFDQDTSYIYDHNIHGLEHYLDDYDEEINLLEEIQLILEEGGSGLSEETISKVGWYVRMLVRCVRLLH